MKSNKKVITALIIALTSFLLSGNTFADDKTPTTQSHDQHHPDTKAEKDSSGGMMMDHGKMGHMNMDDMHGMMQDCMKEHKDGKMCNHKTMNKCQEKMGKQDCEKMMKKAAKE